MRSVLSMAVCVLVFALSSQQAKAQYPVYGGGYGHGGHRVHHDHHYSVPTPIYQQNYNSGYGSYGVGNALPPVYGSSYSYPQYVPPVTTSIYSNNYYGRPVHSHHSWHPGHYLLGHH
jgi:hypothetical protein